MKKNILLILVFSIVLFSCKKDKIVDEPEKKNYTINGLIQKGPFINGTDITISELNSNLAETGRTFHSTITDNKGSFEVSDIELESGYVKIIADGYFFNEISGSLSGSRITLNAIVDLTDNQKINVNILTSLESERVKYLVTNGETFTNAKSQAKNEVYNIFGFTSPDSTTTEMLNITEEGESNSILLAISTIILGTHTSAELTGLVNSITNEIKEDGELNNEAVQSQLINEATLLNIDQIKANLISKYSEMGQTIEINNFGFYVNQFINSTDYIFTKYIRYPSLEKNYLNILSDTTINYTGGVKYCFAAYLPKGTKCKVKYKQSGSGFGIFTMDNNGWTISTLSDNWWELSANGTGDIVMIPAMFGPPNSVEIYVYENGSNDPVISKTIGY